MPLIQENSEDAIALESLVDKHGLHNVIAVIGDICGGKAEHIRTNWQDTDLAKAWERNATLLDKARAKLVATE